MSKTAKPTAIPLRGTSQNVGVGGFNTSARLDVQAAMIRNATWIIVPSYTDLYEEPSSAAPDDPSEQAA